MGLFTKFINMRGTHTSLRIEMRPSQDSQLSNNNNTFHRYRRCRSSVDPYHIDEWYVELNRRATLAQERRPFHFVMLLLYRDIPRNLGANISPVRVLLSQW